MTSRQQKLHGNLLPLTLSPFESSQTILQASSLMFHGFQFNELHTLPDNLLIFDLPEVKPFAQSLCEQCNEAHCSLGDGLDSIAIFDATPKSCKRKAFVTAISYVVADILSLSLFSQLKSLKVKISGFLRIRIKSRNLKNEFRLAVIEILTSGRGRTCAIYPLSRWALVLVGHDLSHNDNMSSWIMSSFKGQTVYPTIYQTHQVQETGYLSLTWLRGVIRHKGEEYVQLRNQVTCYDSDLPGPPFSEDSVTRPPNLTPLLRMAWSISRMPKGTLVATIGVEPPDEQMLFGRSSPADVFKTLMRSVIVTDYPHDRNLPLQCADQSCRYVAAVEPFFPGPQSKSRDINVNNNNLSPGDALT